MVSATKRLIKREGSWRTTLAAVLASLAILASNGVALLDDDPETKVDPQLVLMELATLATAFGLAKARDDAVSSEQAREARGEGP